MQKREQRGGNLILLIPVLKVDAVFLEDAGGDERQLMDGRSEFRDHASQFASSDRVSRPISAIRRRVLNQKYSRLPGSRLSIQDGNCECQR
jgi:hypothetical protein